MTKKKKRPEILSLEFGGKKEQRHLGFAMAIAASMKYHLDGVSHIQMLYRGRSCCGSCCHCLCIEDRRQYVLLAACKNGESQSLAVFPTKPLSSQELLKDIERFFQKHLKNGARIKRKIYGTCADIGMASNLSDSFVAPVQLSMAEIKIYKLLATINDEGKTIEVKNPRKFVTDRRARNWNAKAWQRLQDKGVVEKQSNDTWLIHRIEYTLLKAKKKEALKADASPKKPTATNTAERRALPMCEKSADPILLTQAEYNAYQTILDLIPDDKTEIRVTGIWQRLKDKGVNPYYFQKMVEHGLATKGDETEGRKVVYVLYRKAVQIKKGRKKASPVHKKTSKKPGNGKALPNGDWTDLATQVAARINNVGDMGQFLISLGKALDKQHAHTANTESTSPTVQLS